MAQHTISKTQTLVYWCDGLTPARGPPKPLLLSQTRERKYNGSWVKIRTGDHSAITITGKTGSIWENQFNFINSKNWSRIMRNKT